jgi:hypothetical protein
MRKHLPNTKSINKNLLNKSKFVFVFQLFIFGKIVSHQKDYISEKSALKVKI